MDLCTHLLTVVYPERDGWLFVHFVQVFTSLIRESTKGSFWFDAVIRFMIKIKDTDKKKEYSVGLTHF